MKSISLVIATPDALLVEAEVTEVIAPGSEGYFGVLPGHCRFITTLKAGTVRYRQGTTETESLEVKGGFADITPNSVTILAQTTLPRESAKT
jgi:F-type H+-transporting ATPase subunit epsilon